VLFPFSYNLKGELTMNAEQTEQANLLPELRAALDAPRTPEHDQERSSAAQYPVVFGISFHELIGIIADLKAGYAYVKLTPTGKPCESVMLVRRKNGGAQEKYRLRGMESLPGVSWSSETES
jgi:hypothetical protein